VTRDDPEAVVVDTMVYGWLIGQREDSLADKYRALVGQARVMLALQTVAEVRSGALLAGWGELRTRRLERSISRSSVVQPDDAMATAYARLRNDCQRAGHALAAKDHVGDLWIAATAVRLNVPLVSDDGIFKGLSSVRLLSVDA